MMANIKNRDTTIDFLRFLGFTLIVLAHVQAPYSITQLRCFDVPLMIFVSGLTASGKKIDNYWIYISKRTKRLVIPVWLFLSLYLTSFYALQSYILPKPYLTIKMIVRSFLLLDDSIGYVWIIRVFLLIMLVTPLLLAIVNKVKHNCTFVSVIIGLLITTETIVHWLSLLPEGLVKDFVRDYVVYCIAYSIPFLIGVRLKQENNKNTWIVLLSLVFIFLISCICVINEGNNLIDISHGYKVPPRYYYIIFGVLISALLWATRIYWKPLTNNILFLFVGQNTIWIYLWHMPLALFCSEFINQWWLRYIIVYSISITIFYFQSILVSRYCKEPIKKYLLG